MVAVYSVPADKVKRVPVLEYFSGQQDLVCEVNGVTYQDGQSFQPSCNTYCHCKGGGVTCVPTCANDIRLPTPDCPNPQHVLLPGKCCKEWVCENLENTIMQDAITGKQTAWTRMDGCLICP